MYRPTYTSQPVYPAYTGESSKPIRQAEDVTVDPFALFKAVQDQRPYFVPKYNSR